MPDPKKHIDDKDYTYVEGYVRKKKGSGGSKTAACWVTWVFVICLGLYLLAQLSRIYAIILAVVVGGAMAFYTFGRWRHPWTPHRMMLTTVIRMIHDDPKINL